MNFTVLRYDSIASTNAEAIEQASRGADEGLCIVAREQTSGRGRLGRKWVSKKDAGLYFSIILRPKIEKRLLPLLTLMTAVAVHDVLEDLYELKPDIKWSNDVLVGGKKICGILAETVESGKDISVVIGVGVNLLPADRTVKLAEIATSIAEETNQKPDIETVLHSLIKFFGYFYDRFQDECGAAFIRDEWAQRSTFFDNKRVKVKMENETFYGTTLGLEENGALRVKKDNGEMAIIQAGDVERLRNT